MRISDWSSDVCSSDLRALHLSTLPGIQIELRRAAARGRFAGPLTLGAAGRVAGELQEAWRGTTAPARRRPAGSSTVTLVPTSSCLTLTRRPPCSPISALLRARDRKRGLAGQRVSGRLY